jgi:glutamate formiminotransferase
MSTLVECVPNFSEGRDKAKVDAIVEAMKRDGVYLLDREMDSDHNRCVITLVGEREAIQEAAMDKRIRAVVAAETFSDLRTVAVERAPFFFTPMIIRRALRLAE